MNRSFHVRCTILCLAMVAGLSALSFRLIQLQLIDRHRYAESAHKAYDRVEVLPGPRGLILDRNEEVLAKSLPVSSVVVDRNHLNDPKLAALGLAYERASQEPGWDALDDTLKKRKIMILRGKILDSEDEDQIVRKHLAYAIGVLARPLGMRREELRDKIENTKGAWIPIAKDLPDDVADGLRDAISHNWIQGFTFENSLKRWYTAPNLATHVVGFTGEKEETGDNGKPVHRCIGVFGVEAALESYLAGRDGWREHRRDARGLLIPGDATSLKPPRAGLNVQLTLDMGTQAIVEEELDAALAEYQSPRGAVIVMDPKTGEVLAMASRPHFDLNRRENVGQAGLNFAMQAIYEPGSTFKIVAVGSALNEGLVTPQTSIFCHNGLYQEGPIRVPDHSPYGMLTVEGIIQKSSNIGAYKIARQLGMQRFYDYVGRWGFGRKTGILLSGESSGFVRHSGNAVDFSRASYGYSLNVTPLQIATAYCAVANGGSLLKPHIVKSLIANDGTVVERYEPEVVGQVIKPKAAGQLRAALEKVVAKDGTAFQGKVPGIRTGGKTGTAKMHNPNGHGYLEGRYTVSFVGLVPADDPAFVCVVVIDDPRTKKVTLFGGTIAAPAFSKIATRIAAHMNIQPTEPETPGLAHNKQP
jgi:cell division protein FtsI/penicillin-binding protein 2